MNHIRSKNHYEEHRICFTDNPPDKFVLEFDTKKVYFVEHHFDIDQIKKSKRSQFLALSIGHELELSGMFSIDIICIDNYLKD